MTVDELKAILEEIPGDCKVTVVDYETERCEIAEVKYMKIHRERDCEESLEIFL
jgi:hypothetical protein